MTTELIKYTYDDYEKIMEQGIDYTLPSDILLKIQNIAEQVGAPGYIRTPVFKKKRDDKKIPIDFKATVIAKAEGIDVHISNIRSCLNKITSTNYDKLCSEIMDTLDKLSDDISEEEWLKINSFIYDTACSNKAFSKIYAQLYSELMMKYDIMQQIFNTSYNSYMEMFNNIESVTSAENYDLFCKLNKINETRKAMSLFITSMFHYEIVDINIIVNIVLKLQDSLLKNIHQDNKKSTCQEIFENIFIFVKECLEEIKTHDKWNNVENTIKLIRNIKVKETPSMSNKLLFKHMDILDIINKS